MAGRKLPEKIAKPGNIGRPGGVRALPQPDETDADMPVLQSDVERLAAEEGLPIEVVEKAMVPASREEKEKARRALQAEEHALALDERTVTAIGDKLGIADAGLALALQMNDLDAQDEIERMISLQLVAMHGLTLRAVRRAHATEHLGQYRDFVNTANKSSRTFAALLEARNRHRGKTSEQKVTVEHVHVYEGGQAIVGAVQAPQGSVGGKEKKVAPPHE